MTFAQSPPKAMTAGAGAGSALAEGAALVQVYSALIFEGPGLVKQLNRGLA